MRKKRGLTLLAVFLAVLAIAGGLVWTGDRKPAKDILQILPAGIDLQVREMRYVELGGSGGKWEIDADAASYLRKDNKVLLDRVKIRFETDDGNTYRLSGDKGKYNTKTGDVELTGNVQILSEEGDRFRTERLFFSRNEELIFTKEPVVIETQSIHVRSRGMSLSLRDNTLTLNSAVRAQIQ